MCKLYAAKALAPYTTIVRQPHELTDFLDKMDSIKEHEIMDELFANETWNAFRQSGYYPYNFGSL